MSNGMDSTYLRDGNHPALMDDALAAYLHVLRIVHGPALLALLARGLSVRDVLVLHLLGERGSSGIDDLAVAGGLSQAYAGLVVNGLTERGLVTLEEHPDDRQRWRARLTERGSALMVPFHQPSARLEHMPSAPEMPDLVDLALGLPALAAQSSTEQ